ncbi:MAG: glycosyltransferase, partial [candidate division KSB1 bacterium]|nr:glycosyltransferase [candidate division KSB1 bacterium]
YEYMACGKCVVASRLGQIAEAIEDGRSGFLVEPGKIEDYLAALQKLIDDPQLRRSMGSAAAEQAMTHYSWATKGRQWVSVCERVLEQYGRKQAQEATGTPEHLPVEQERPS